MALVLATGLARHPAGLSALAFSKIGCCGVGRSAEIRTRDPQSPRLKFYSAISRLGKPEALQLAQKWLKPSVYTATNCQHPPLCASQMFPRGGLT